MYIELGMLGDPLPVKELGMLGLGTLGGPLPVTPFDCSSAVGDAAS